MKKRLLLLLLIRLTFSTTWAQVTLTDSDLPIIRIQTINGATIVDEPKVTADMDIIFNGVGQRNNISDEPTEYSGQIGIEVRGASSQSYPKKGYALETRQVDGTNNNVSLFGMPKENDWILHGPFSDKSLIRNALAYKLAGMIMPYAPRTQFCELIINGNYRGLYLFTEKIKRDEGRVDINELRIDQNAGDSLTGGYIIKIDKLSGDGNLGWTSQFAPEPGFSQRIFYQYHYPKPEVITAAQKNYIRELVDKFETVMQSDDFGDTLNGYHQYLDPTTVIDFILVNELCRNVDAYRLSTYLYKDRDCVDPRLKLGPVWDFNLGFGNADFCAGPEPMGWIIDYNEICPEDGFLIPQWWRQLLEDKYFGERLVNRWRSLRENEYANDRILACLDDLTTELNEAQARNFQRWPILDQYIWPNAYIGGSYPAEVNEIRNWIRQRLLWMDNFIETLNRYTPPNNSLREPKVYPNPFTTLVKFDYYGIQGQEVKLRIYDSSGKYVTGFRRKLLDTGRRDIEWNNEQAPKGIYYYKMWIDDELFISGSLLKE